jgi:hypothetical protein
MKKIMIILILGFVLSAELKAQINITIPPFYESSVILYASLAFSGDHEFYFYDGGTALPVIKVPIPKGQGSFSTFYPAIGYTINELKKRSYKLIDTEFANGNNIYYFQKD